MTECAGYNGTNGIIDGGDVGDGIRITGSRFENQTNRGIWLGGGADSALIVGNTVYNVEINGIEIDGDYCLLTNNIITAAYRTLEQGLSTWTQKSGSIWYVTGYKQPTTLSINDSTGTEETVYANLDATLEWFWTTAGDDTIFVYFGEITDTTNTVSLQDSLNNWTQKTGTIYYVTGYAQPTNLRLDEILGTRVTTSYDSLDTIHEWWWTTEGEDTIFVFWGDSLADTTNVVNLEEKAIDLIQIDGDNNWLPYNIIGGIYRGSAIDDNGTGNRLGPNIGVTGGPQIDMSDGKYIGVNGGGRIFFDDSTPDEITVQEAYLQVKAADAGLGRLIVETYSETDAAESALVLFKSADDTLDIDSTTTTGEDIASIRYQGVDAAGNQDYGFYINGKQNGAAGTHVPMDVTFVTYSATAPNSNQLKLHSDGGVQIGDGSEHILKIEKSPPYFWFITDTDTIQIDSTAAGVTFKTK